jgi:dUTPase
MPVVATRAVIIPKGTRLAQFRVNLSQKATVWQKLKWLFSSGVKLKKVNSLNNPNRNGFGSTGN